jgi:hypothetical protein
MRRNDHNESPDGALVEIENRVEELVHYCSTIRVHTVKAMEPRGPWVHLLTMIQPCVGDRGPGREGNRQYPNVALLEEFVEPRELVSYLKALRDNTARVGKELLDRAGDGVFKESHDHPGYNRYSEYPGRLYLTTGRPNHIFNVEHLLAPGQPYYPDLSQAIREWTGAPVRIGTADGYIGSVLLFLPECSARIQSLVRDEDAINVTLALGPTAVKDLRLIGGWQEGDTWRRFDELVNHSEPNLRLSVPRSAGALNIHLIGGSGRWYDYHLEDRRGHVGQQRVLDSSGTQAADVQALEKALRQGEGEQIEFKEYIRKRDQKEAEIVKVIVAFANTKGGVIYLGVSDECELIGTDVDLCRAFPNEGADLEKALADYIGYLKSSLPEKMNHTPSLDYPIIRTGGHRILAITVEPGVDRIYMRRSDKGIFVRRGASSPQADADDDIPRLVRERLGREWQIGDPIDW